MHAPEPDFITIGEIVAVWGNQGKVRVKVTTDFLQRFAPQATVYINRRPVTIDRRQWHRNQAIIKLRAVDSIHQAQQLCGQLIEIPRSQAYPLAEDEYYHFQLIGLEVWTTQGQRLGNIVEVLSGVSNDNYVVRGTSGEILIPAIEDVVQQVDLDRGRMTIEAIEGLLT